MSSRSSSDIAPVETPAAPSTKSDVNYAVLMIVPQWSAFQTIRTNEIATVAMLSTIALATIFGGLWVGKQTVKAAAGDDSRHQPAPER